MQVVGYSDAYKSGVLACLKRNYKWMGEKSDDELYQWLAPIVSYVWESDFPIDQYPYKFGMVLLGENNTVVGYLGLIYSKQEIDGCLKTVVNPTTWAIDEAYRSETFRCIYSVQQTADIMVDFTARQSLLEIFTKMFHFITIDTQGCFFLPKPVLGKRHIKLKRISRAEQIENETIKTIYRHHFKYNVKCFMVSDGVRNEYIFYKIHKRVTVLKGFVPLKGIYVLYTSDSVFFGEHAKEIIWKMQKKEKAALKTDSRFFNIDTGNEPNVRTFSINRLVFGAQALTEQPSLLYSELAILLEE